MARTPGEIEPHVFTVNGVAISHLSYTFGYNGLHLPAGEEWRSAVIDPTRIIADATTARALGAQLVIVSLHWGVEGQSAITPAQRQLAEQLTASGVIDLIVGNHAHVLQPIEQVNGVWVIYGLGNMISNMPTGDRWPAATQDGALVGVTFTRRTDGLFEVSIPVVYPTWCDRDAGWIVRLVEPTLADPATPDGLRWQLETSLARTQAVLGPYIAP
jgi:poly-gamma-glutamate synthesis protein (capsule biosynthesis protein)